MSLTCSFCVFQVSKKFFPDVSVGYEDPRVTLHIGDGMNCFFLVPLFSSLANLFNGQIYLNLQELHF